MTLRPIITTPDEPLRSTSLREFHHHATAAIAMKVLRGSRSAPLVSTAHPSYQYIKPPSVSLPDLSNSLHRTLTITFTNYGTSHVKQNRSQDRSRTNVQHLASSCCTSPFCSWQEVHNFDSAVPCTQKSNDPKDLEPPQPGAGLTSKPEMEAFRARGPHVPNREALINAGPPAVSSRPPLHRSERALTITSQTSEELAARTAELNK